MKAFSYLLIIITLTLTACNTQVEKNTKLPRLKISENKRFFVDENNQPFFWLGDTGWLLFKKLDRTDAEKYLEDRKQKGFNVIQVMVVHNVNDAGNVYGDSALIGENIATPRVTEGSSFENDEEYDFWDHADYIIKLAEEKGLYMALVPIWGSNVKSNHITPEQATAYGSWIANRYKDQKNIIWLNGGDIVGTDSIAFWKALGTSLRANDTSHLITFHPRGRMQSSWWFQDEPWLDFNMIQSGHRNYEQDDTEWNYGEDNWRFVENDYKLEDVKPTIDGEPSYEGIPQGLHDTLQPYWNDSDIRRYAYWSVFTGAFGFTYGHNAVMQFYVASDTNAAYGPKLYWNLAINEAGAQQMIHLKELMLSRSYLDRVPDQSLIADGQGERYNYLIATRGNTYAFIYTYTGRNMKIAMGKIAGKEVKASWFNPSTGITQEIGKFKNEGVQEFDAPGEIKNGNDWVLILDSIL